jgi:hypothetical protein
VNAVDPTAGLKDWIPLGFGDRRGASGYCVPAQSPPRRIYDVGTRYPNLLDSSRPLPEEWRMKGAHPTLARSAHAIGDELVDGAPIG